MKKKNLHSLPKGGSGAERLEHALQHLNVDQLARQTRFCRRTPRKLSALTFLHSCFLVLLQTRASLRQWALVIGLVGNQTYAKQSLFKRLNPAALLFVQRVLQAFLARLSLGAQRVLPPALDSFKRVLLQDSVILSLSPGLARSFPGTGNQFGLRGMLRVQVLLDLKHEQFVRFGHGPYTRNDLQAAREGLEQLQPGDLLIRDLGFYVVAALRRLQDLGVCFLSRVRSDATLFLPEGTPLDLVRALRGRDRWDAPVLLGGEEKLPVRLVALKVPAAVANQRRRKARQNRRYRPSRRHLWFLGWNIYITNVGRRRWPTPEQVGQVYALRWRIETTFRTWKQHLHLEDMPTGSPTQVAVLLYARLLFISLFQVQYLGVWDYQIQQEPTPPISQEKLAALMPLLVSLELLPHFQSRLKSALAKQIAYHCTYEKRKRKHFIDQLALS
jgi:hypothetical protein